MGARAASAPAKLGAVPSRQPAELISARRSLPSALEVAIAGALLDAVAGGNTGPILRIYRPAPTVAFGRQDRFRQGFAAASAAARAHGFTPVLRAPGGHAAAYDEGALVIDEVRPERDPISGIQERFADHAQLQAHALRRLGVDARIGKIPGEYCPGDFSISAGARTKLVGTAQRVVRGAWLFSTVVIVEGAGRIRTVLEDVYAALGLDWDPQTVGAVAEEAPGVGLDELEQALLECYAARVTFVPGALSTEILTAAQRSIDRYELP